MEIPKIISVKGREYILVKQVNKDLFQYKEMINNWNECFSRYDLGLIKTNNHRVKTIKLGNEWI